MIKHIIKINKLLKSINNTIQGSTKCKFFHQPQKAKHTELTKNRKLKHSIFLTSGNFW